MQPRGALLETALTHPSLAGFELLLSLGTSTNPLLFPYCFMASISSYMASSEMQPQAEAAASRQGFSCLLGDTWQVWRPSWRLLGHCWLVLTS